MLASNKLIQHFYFSYLAYGLYAALLSYESSLFLLEAPLKANFLLLIGLLTICYYGISYLYAPIIPFNERSRWWSRNKKSILLLYSLIGIAASFAARKVFVHESWPKQPLFWVIFTLTALLSLLYYGWPKSKLNIRRLAVYKPFIIGLIWSCVTVILPTLFFDKQTFNAKIFLWSFQQLVFIALLAIVFDIKDSSSDAEDGLNTFIIQLGFKRLKIFILYPLLLISCFATFFSFYPFLDSQLNLIFLPFVPFIAALLLIKRIHEQKPVLYYLAWVDGLLLVKAASGIMLFYCKN
ncbi:MAG: hypothetical protein MUF12_02585 [Sediminibacterium sp.]|nr:hypothetical protein [Sediminibacterium sp.]